MADVNEYSFTTGTSFFQQPQPLFLSSTKKGPRAPERMRRKLRECDQQQDLLGAEKCLQIFHGLASEAKTANVAPASAGQRADNHPVSVGRPPQP
jgi:hypothetical protein